MAKPNALETFLLELNVTTDEDRRSAMRYLQFMLDTHTALKRSTEPLLTDKQWNEWATEVCVSADKLAGLLCVAWGRDEDEDLIERLRTLKKDHSVPLKLRKGRPENKEPRWWVIGLCHNFYEDRTGRPIGAGRRNNLGRKKQGEPVGPFFRLVKAVLTLAGDKAGDEAVLSAIREYQRRGKRIARGRGLITPEAAE